MVVAEAIVHIVGSVRGGQVGTGENAQRRKDSGDILSSEGVEEMKNIIESVWRQAITKRVRNPGDSHGREIYRELLVGLGLV